MLCWPLACSYAVNNPLLMIFQKFWLASFAGFCSINTPMVASDDLGSMTSLEVKLGDWIL